MSRKKLLLLGMIAVLSAILVFQTALGGGTSIRTCTLDQTIDQLRIRKQDGSIIGMKKVNGQWLVGDNEYPGDAARIESLVGMLSSVKVLDTVSRRQSYHRYGLDPGTALTVTASAGGEEVRTLTVGKAASTARQSYVLMDQGKDVLLVSGDLSREFGIRVDDLREKEVYTVNPDEVIRIASTAADAYTLERNLDTLEWTLASAGDSGEEDERALDAEQLDRWITGLSTLKAESYPEDAAVPDAPPLGMLVLDLGHKQIQVTILSKGEDNRYLCSSSESPYLFTLAAWAGERYLKPLDELLAK